MGRLSVTDRQMRILEKVYIYARLLGSFVSATCICPPRFMSRSCDHFECRVLGDIFFYWSNLCKANGKSVVAIQDDICSRFDWFGIVEYVVRQYCLFGLPFYASCREACRNRSKAIGEDQVVWRENKYRYIISAKTSRTEWRNVQNSTTPRH